MDNVINDKKLFRIQLIAVFVGLILMVAKFFTYSVTHSNTVLTDALESIINVMAGSFALYSLHISSKPQDYDHPYGHGKVEFISAGLEGIMILIAGALIIVQAVITFVHPHSLQKLNLGLLVIIGSGLLNFIMGLSLKRTGEKHSSLTLEADGQHLLTDAYSALGFAIGIALIIFTGWLFLDNIVAIVFGIIIIQTGIKLIRKSLGGMMDEADERIDESIIAHLVAHRKGEWIDFHNLRVIQYGSKLHVDCHLTLPWYFTLEQAHKEIDEIVGIINKEYFTEVEFFIHGDPCVPRSCPICMIGDCKVRQAPFVKKVEWTLENVRLNKKHGLE